MIRLGSILLVVAVLCLLPTTDALYLSRARALDVVLGGGIHQLPFPAHADNRALRLNRQALLSVAEASHTHQSLLHHLSGQPNLFAVSFYPTANCTDVVQNLQLYVTSCQPIDMSTWGKVVLINGTWVYQYDCTDNTCNTCLGNNTVPTNTCLRANTTESMVVRFGGYAELTAAVRTGNYMRFNQHAVDLDPNTECASFYNHETYHVINACSPAEPWGSRWTCTASEARGRYCSNNSSGCSVCAPAEVSTPAEGCLTCGTFESTCMDLPALAHGGVSAWEGVADVGEWVNLTCQDGYSLLGDTRALCTGGNGYLYTGTAAPHCEAALCTLDAVALLTLDHIDSSACGPLPTGSTCELDCAEGFFRLGGSGYAVNATCTGTVGGTTSSWVYPSFECLPIETQIECGQSLLQRLEIFGDPPSLPASIPLTCPTDCALPYGSIYGGAPWYTFDSDFCTATRHATGNPGGTFDIAIRVDLLFNATERIPNYPSVLGPSGLLSTLYNATYPVIFRVLGVHGVPPEELLSTSTSIDDVVSAVQLKQLPHPVSADVLNVMVSAFRSVHPRHSHRAPAAPHRAHEQHRATPSRHANERRAPLRGSKRHQSSSKPRQRMNPV